MNADWHLAKHDLSLALVLFFLVFFFLARPASGFGGRRNPDPLVAVTRIASAPARRSPVRPARARSWKEPIESARSADPEPGYRCDRVCSPPSRVKAPKRRSSPSTRPRCSSACDSAWPSFPPAPIGMQTYTTSTVSPVVPLHSGLTPGRAPRYAPRCNRTSRVHPRRDARSSSRGTASAPACDNESRGKSA